MITIGIAIPCYNLHIDRCKSLLDSIEIQTRLPDAVVISCSSTKDGEFILTKSYSFSVEIITTPDKKNPAENRNIASSHLFTTVVSFFDGDDIMHPQRIEYIEKAFQDNSDIVLHSYLKNEECDIPFKIMQEFNIEKNVLRQCYSGCITHKENYNIRIHHAQVSVKKEIIRYITFPEEKTYETREDCVFCFRVFNLSNVQSAYIREPLSKYIPSCTQTCGR